MQSQLLGQYAAVQVHTMQQMMEQQQLMANAQAFQDQNAKPGQPGPKSSTAPPNMGPGGNPPMNKNELMNESLPTAGGGK